MPTEQQKTKLLDAIRAKETTTVEEKIGSQPSLLVDSLDQADHKALHIAADEPRNKETIKVLLKHNANPNITDIVDNTPLHHAALRGGPSNATTLINNNANIEAVNTHGNTPLLNASLIGNLRIMELLVKNNADIQAKNNDGQGIVELTQSQTTEAHEYAKKLLQDATTENNLSEDAEQGNEIAGENAPYGHLLCDLL